MISSARPRRQFHCLNRKGIPHAPGFTAAQYKKGEAVPGYQT